MSIKKFEICVIFNRILCKYAKSLKKNLFYEFKYKKSYQIIFFIAIMRLLKKKKKTFDCF